MSTDLRSSGAVAEDSPAQAHFWTARFGGSPPALSVATRPPAAGARLVTADGLALLFDGVLYERERLARELGEPAGAEAELVLRSWLRFGPAGLKELRGCFALALHDLARGELFLARDPLGAHPLFYAPTSEGLFLSPSTNALAREPAVSGKVNRALLADNFCRRWPVPEETYYEQVKRVPSGHVVRVGAGSPEAWRYWDPSPPGEPVDWADDEQVEHFDDLLDQAVDRCLSQGPAGIYLSGGLDSVSVAAVARDRTALHGLPTPHALSLAFPEPESNEVDIQRAVASKLDLPQTFVSIEDAAGSDGLLRTVLELGSARGAPIIGCWLPGYRRLGLEAKAAGCQTIMTGAGGDEWLGITFYLAADLIKRLDLPGLFRLGRMARRSFTVATRVAITRNLLWSFGLRPILRAQAIRALRPVAPGLIARRRRRRTAAAMPDWVAPDGELRELMLTRAEEGMANLEWERSGSFYLQQGRISLDHAIVSMELEEVFQNGSHLGVRMMQPYWDPDLVDLLYRIPPEALTRGGRAKGLVRDTLARRFPNLGLENQKKVIATRYFTSLMVGEGRAIWDEMGGPQGLIELGILDGKRIEAAAKALFAKADARAANRIWNILNLEAWVRPRI